jgi:hypothetical protein
VELVARFAVVAAITFSLAVAVASGVIFGQAVSTPAETPQAPEREQSALTVDAPVTARKATAWPAKGASAQATEIAKSRSGVVSFAAIGPGENEVGFEPDRQFFSASVSKAMLLVAELRRLRREDAPLDSQTQRLLEQMITLSDNDAADVIYERVGDPGLNEVAALSGMTNFGGNVGHWSNVQLTAGDLARFMSRLDQLLHVPHGDEGSEMLASVISSQRWGIPEAAPGNVRVRLKGGWRPADDGQLVHQMARVDMRGESYSIAILTDGNPSQAYGEETIRLIAAELLP